MTNGHTIRCPVGPSDRHIVKVVYQDTQRFTERCERCGRHFCSQADGTGPVWCLPSRAWLSSHPEDDGRPRTGWIDCYRRAS